MRYNHVFPSLKMLPLEPKDDLVSVLERDGVVLLNVGESFSNKSFLELMCKIGTPLKESNVDAAYVEDLFILNVRTDIDSNISMENEPFSIDGLRMHVERAFANQTVQPNFIALLCKVCPVDENGGQTLIYRMSDFVKCFSANELMLMRKMYPVSMDRKIISVNPILSYDRRRGFEFFSYRDLGQYGKDWHVKDDPTLNALDVYLVANKIGEVLGRHANIRALVWRPGYLYIFDNKKSFHGRTEQKQSQKRHLKRIRVI